MFFACFGCLSKFATVAETMYTVPELLFVSKLKLAQAPVAPSMMVSRSGEATGCLVDRRNMLLNSMVLTALTVVACVPVSAIRKIAARRGSFGALLRSSGGALPENPKRLTRGGGVSHLSIRGDAT